MRLGLIGVGNMGGAILQGVIGSNIYDVKDIFIFNRTRSKVEGFIKQGVNFLEDEVAVARNADILIIGVKPQSFKALSDIIGDSIDENTIVVSIAAGISLLNLEEMFGKGKYIRVMPNTPALVRSGMTAICKNELASLEDLELIKGIFDAVGSTTVIEESMIDAFSGICGCMPAYVYMFIEAAADAAVKNGIKRDDAYKYIAQTLKGSAEMILETGKHPGQLKDQVTSPGGSTIRGVLALEEAGFRNAVIKAVDASSNYKIDL